MNVFHNFAKKSLLANKTRTIVTVIGIILSTAMLTAVTTMASSIRQYGIAYEEAVVGDWHVRASGVRGEEYGELLADSRVASGYVLRDAGYARIPGVESTYKPYFCVQEMDESFAEHMPLTIVEGRLPEQPGEVLVPGHVLREKEIGIAVGDTLTLSVGYRVDGNGRPLWQTDEYRYTEYEDGSVRVWEQLDGETERTYTVVGICNTPAFEQYLAPGYTLLTVGGSGIAETDYCDCYLITANPKDSLAFYRELKAAGIASDYNYKLLRFHGISERSDFNSLIYGMGGILIVIIVLGSVALIYNAFAISIGERTKQFGLLTSIGATRRQMLWAVCYEAFLLCVVGIPLGIAAGICGMGITLSFFTGQFEYLIGSVSGVHMKLYVSVTSVLLAAVIGVATVLLSAWLPMRRALKISAIDAIRQRKDIRLTRRSVAAPAWVNRMFGLEGVIAWKNFKRNRKQYRVTVFSLAMSILLFVSVGSFSEYLFGGYRNAVEISRYDIYVNLHADSYGAMMELRETVGGVAGPESVYEYYSMTMPGTVEGWENLITEEAGEWYADDAVQEAVSICFLPDHVFADLVAYYGLDAGKYDDPAYPQAVAFNHILDSNDAGETMELDVLRDGCGALRFLPEEEEAGAEASKAADGTAAGAEAPGAADGTAAGAAVECRIGDLVTNDVYRQTEFSEDCLAVPGGIYRLRLIYPVSMMEPVTAAGFTLGEDAWFNGALYYETPQHKWVAGELQKMMSENPGVIGYSDMAESEEQHRALYLMANVFCYGFIILISLISAANIFHTISTNIGLRRREFAMLSSIGMKPGERGRMLRFECLIYGGKGLVCGFLLSAACNVLMYYAGMGTMEGFYVVWRYYVIAAVCVFAVVYVTMLYAGNRIKRENLIETLKGDGSA